MARCTSVLLSLPISSFTVIAMYRPTTKANSASAALNKWLKVHVSGDIVVHSLRHAMRDRLRAVECPAEVIDQIGGWSRKGVGESYGRGYQVEQLWRWMAKAVG
jgi:integrase